MRITNAVSGRPNYLDRNPLVINAMGYVNFSTAPHAQTQRAIYTVPSNRKAQVTTIAQLIQRQSVATTAGYAQIRTYRNAQTGEIDTGVNTNNIGDKDRINTGAAQFLAAGDSMPLFTVDPSTGGTFTFATTVDIIEYDA